MKKLFLLTTISVVVLFFIPLVVEGAVVINEVYYNPEGGNDTGKEYIILYNNGDSDFNLINYELNAVSGDYFVFPSFSLNPESFVTVHWRKEGANTLTDLYTGTSGFDANMGNAKGWVALFNSSSHNKDTIIDYLEYGEAGRTWESTAVSAGIWIAGDFIPDVEAGKVIKLKTNGVDNNLSSDWSSSAPTIATEDEMEEPTEGGVEPGVAPTTGNQPPIPDAGDNIIAFIDQEINFDGSNSSDPDNDELAYSWNMGDGKLIEEKTFTYKYLYAGTYLVTLMVYDGQYYATDTITVKIQSQQITINEFIPNPEGEDVENEWIEIYNDSDSVVDVSGWQLDDEASGSQPFTFPQNTLIAPKSYLVFARRITKIALNNDKDSVRLLLPEGIVFQEINYEKPKEGQSSAHTPEGFVWSPPTPGMPNLIGVAVAEGVGGEVFYQQPIEPETTKESPQDYSWYYSTPEAEIEGGYAKIAKDIESIKGTEDIAGIEEIKDIKDKSEPELAMVEENLIKGGSINLILLIITIILGATVIGLSVVKFRKKFP